MITLKQAKNLRYGQVLEHTGFLTNANGTPMRFRVNGKVKTWKRDANRVRVPLKRGLWEYGYLTNNTWEGGGFNLDLTEVTILG